jgi:transposase
MAYSKDYRKRAVEYKDSGHSFKELKEVFKIPPETYYGWKEKLENGCCEKKKKVERKRLIDKEKLAAAVKEKPGAYLHELAEPFGRTPQAAHYALEKMKITYKKNVCVQREKGKSENWIFRESVGNTDRKTSICRPNGRRQSSTERTRARASRGQDRGG